jgi:hypothetical protein
MSRKETCLCRFDRSFHTCALGVGHFTLKQAALKAASSKITKYKKLCYDNQHVFIPFAFDTFEFLAPETLDLLKKGLKSCISMLCRLGL